MKKKVLKNDRRLGGKFENEKENRVTDDGREENAALKVRKKVKETPKIRFAENRQTDA